MKKRLKWAIGSALIIGAIVALVPMAFSGDVLKRAIAAQVKEATGLTLVAKGRAVIGFLPRPRIKLADVEIDDPGGSLHIESEQVLGNLRLLPMLAGHLELANIDLVVPTVDINVEGKPLSANGAIARAINADPTKATSQGIDAARLGTISFNSGLARIKSTATSAATLISNINLTLDWQRLSSPAGLSGSLVWGGETADLTAWVQNPAALLHGAPSSVTIAVDSLPLTVSLDGSAVGGAGGRFEGQMHASSPSLRTLARLFGFSAPLPGPLANATLAGTATLTPKNLSLSGLDFTVDGNKFEGSLALDASGVRPAISGTLAAEFLAAAPLVVDVPPIWTGGGGWNDEPFTRDGLAFADLDLRVSATHARVARYQLEDAGISVLLKDSNLEISLAEAKAYGGMVKGRIDFVATPSGATLAAEGDFDGVDAGALLDDGIGTARVTGSAKGNFDLEGSGDSMASLVRSLTGSGKLSLSGGDIIGIDLEQALRRLEKRPLSIASEVRSGRTSFDTASGSFSLADGTAALQQILVSGPGIQLSLAGNIDLAGRRLDLNALAQQAGTDAHVRPGGPQLRFDIAGPWEAPALGFDADSLIRRSEAAAPLYGIAGPPAAGQPLAITAPAQLQSNTTYGAR